MLDIKVIRTETERVKKALARRKEVVDIDALLALDNERREALFEVEKKKNDIEEQQKTNEGLAMTINELASLTKIQQVAEEQGLSYNNDNIKTVPDEK